MRRLFTALLLGTLGQPVLAEAPKVITDISPIHSLASMVMGNVGEPVLLLPSGADPHNFQLRPSQARALSEAKLVFWVGPELSPWLERGLEGLGAQARSVPLLEAEVTMTQAFDAQQEGHGHDHDHAHDHEGIDPHAWLDPENARNWLGLMAQELALLDPANAASYAANAAAGKAEIDAAEAQVTALLAPIKDRPFAVFHDAYGYFTGHFGLRSLGSLRQGDAALPGAAHMKELEETLKAGAALCLFPEANHGTDAAAQMAEATGLRLGNALDPEGSALPPGPALYGKMMLGLATTIAACLGQG
jgi:zinc transport system substrate-binding protein